MVNVFQGKLVRLRAGEPSDESLFRDLDREDTDNRRCLHEITFPPPKFDPQAQPPGESKPQDGENFNFTVETLAGEVVGALHMHHCHLRCGTFMYGISTLPEHRRKGYAYEAIWLGMRYYFYERRYQKCTVEVYGFNEASARLHERLGFTLEGRLRRMIYSGGSFHDALYYGITREEFEARDTKAHVS